MKVRNNLRTTKNASKVKSESGPGIVPANGNVRAKASAADGEEAIIKPPQQAADPDGKQSVADGLRQARRAMDNLEAGHNQRLNEQLSKVYAQALLLGSDEDEWLSFCHDSEWEEFPGKPTVEDRSVALRFAVRFAVGFPVEQAQKVAATKRVNTLFSALSVLFADKVQPEDVAQELHERGVANLKKEAARRNKLPTEWTIRFPDNKFAHRFATWKPGQQRGVHFEVMSVDGMMINANIIAAAPLAPKKVGS